MMPRMVPGSPSAHSLHSGRTVHAVVQTQRAASRSSGLAPLSQWPREKYRLQAGSGAGFAMAENLAAERGKAVTEPQCAAFELDG